MSAAPKEVRAARAFLFQRGIKRVSPRLFANSAKELDIGFKELLKFIGTLQQGGQGESQRRQDAIDKELLKRSKG